MARYPDTAFVSPLPALGIGSGALPPTSPLTKGSVWRAGRSLVAYGVTRAEAVADDTETTFNFDINEEGNLFNKYIINYTS